MFYFFLLLPLPVLIVTAYFLNSKKIYDRSGNTYIVEVLEGLGSYLIILSLLLGGFITNPILQIFCFIIGFSIVAFTKNNINEDEPEADVQIETMKNIIVLFSSTVLLFYVMLSVFRFQPWYLQFLYALMVVLVFNVFAFFLKRLVSIIWDKKSFDLSMIVNFSAWYLYVIVFFIFIAIVFFNFPKVMVNQSLNLNNSNGYFGKPDGSNALVNRYKTNELLAIDVEMRMDKGAYINQDEDYVFIYIHDTVTIYDLREDELIYSGIARENIDGIDVNLNNEERNEVIFKTNCDDETGCIEYDYPFEFGDVKYRFLSRIVKIENLEYEHTDTAIFTEQTLHLFDNEAIDSRVSMSEDKPFVEFTGSIPVITDVDNYDGVITYLQIETIDEQLNVKVYEIVENDIDITLPFYSHYRFGMLVYIFLIGFIPISNYDKFRTYIH